MKAKQILKLLAFALIFLACKPSKDKEIPTSRFKILLHPQNGFYYHDSINNITIQGFLRGLNYYNVKENMNCPCKYGSLSYTFNDSLSNNPTYARVQLILSVPKEARYRATLSLSADSNSNDMQFRFFTRQPTEEKLVKIKHIKVDSCFTIPLESQTINKTTTFFLFARNNKRDLNPYRLFSILIEEL